jgi:ABC-2 type transport system permease protein
MILSLQRTQAVVRRYMLLQKRDMNRMFDVAIWPLQDLFLFGFMSAWLMRDASLAQTAYIPLFGAMLWQVVARANMDIGIGLLEEIWSRNLTNMISSPLKRSELLLGSMIYSSIRIAIVAAVCLPIIWFVYGISFTVFGWWIVPIVISLMISGWALGMMSASLVLIAGSRAASFVWAVWVLTPFCGVFNPIAVLPQVLQYVAMLLPMSYVFTAVLQFLKTGVMPVNLLVTSFALGIICFALGFWIFNRCFDKAQQRGIGQLENE